jgi:hypothetical protein
VNDKCRVDANIGLAALCVKQVSAWCRRCVGNVVQGKLARAQELYARGVGAGLQCDVMLARTHQRVCVYRSIECGGCVQFRRVFGVEARRA